LGLFWVKNANFFAKFFGEYIFKIITLVPGHPGVFVVKLERAKILLVKHWTLFDDLVNFKSVCPFWEAESFLWLRFSQKVYNLFNWKLSRKHVYLPIYVHM
jgi:hypothetical protein